MSLKDESGGSLRFSYCQHTECKDQKTSYVHTFPDARLCAFIHATWRFAPVRQFLAGWRRYLVLSVASDVLPTRHVPVLTPQYEALIGRLFLHPVEAAVNEHDNLFARARPRLLFLNLNRRCGRLIRCLEPG